MKKFWKTIQIIIVITGIFLIGAFASIVTERFFMPWASSSDFLNKYEFFKKANEKVTVIEKTEQITVKEDFSVTKTAENVSAAVVNIITSEKSDTAEEEEVKLAIKSSEEIEKRSKTGVILTSDGIVVSVLDEYAMEVAKERAAASSQKTQVAGGEEENEKYNYKVLVSDGREYEADLLEVDFYSNLVFYKIEGDNLPVPNFGNSDELESGEKIVICGNASGEYHNIYSSGIIQEKDGGFSLLNSELSSSEKMEGAIMTSSEINTRNTGGPVVDFNGTMVGITNRIEKDNREVGFIIPIKRVQEALSKLISQGKIERPSLGLYYLSIDKEISILNNLSVEKGALVYSFSGEQGLAVVKNSPADKAGFRIGDIIITAGEEDITLASPLSSIIAGRQKGDILKMKVLRDGEEIELEAALE